MFFIQIFVWRSLVNVKVIDDNQTCLIEVTVLYLKKKMFVTRNSMQWILETASSNLKNWIWNIKMIFFWIWVQQMKWSLSSLVSTPTWNFEKSLKLKKWLQFELWTYNQGSKVSRTWKFQLHHKLCHYDVNLWWKFQNFLAYHIFNMNFLHIFVKISEKNLQFLWHKQNMWTRLWKNKK